MIRLGRCTGRHRRSGFTLVEMIIASMLATLLGMLLAGACVTFGRPALEVEARARITQEAILATQSLACDLGGFLADGPGRTGNLGQYQFVDPAWDLSQGNPPGTVLLLNFQGATSGDLIVISYQLQGNLLVRSNSSTGVATTIAKYVTGFVVEPDPGNASNVKITITIAFRYFTTTYTLIGVKPS
jgi:prepilin-type N-terminal cleavage/methylation domain-containing protein